MRDLTPQEQAKLDSFTDPNANEVKFAWNEDFQSKLLGMLLTDRFMLVQSQDKIFPDYFSNEAYVLICKILFKYFQEQKAVPEKWIVNQELADQLKDRDKSIQLHYLAQLDSLYTFYVPGIDTREYLIDKITYFAKVQAVKKAFHKCVDKMQEAPEEEKTWSFVYDQMRQAMVIDRNFEPGLEYFLNIDEMFKRMRETFQGKDRFTTAFESVDASLTGGGLFRGQIGAWISNPGVGKSLGMCKASVANVLLGHKVLYLTMEMDELGIAQRFTSQFQKLDINNLINYEREIKATIEEFGKDKSDNNLLRITQFPGGTMDVNSVRAYHSQLLLRGWKPDLVIIDYVGEFKDAKDIPKYESAYRVIRDLRAFGIEEKHCTITGIQPNISASKLEIHQYIDQSNIGVSFDQFKALDALWSINQVISEKNAEVARGLVVKHRNGKSNFPFYIGFDYKLGTLDMFEISKDRYKSAMNAVQDKVDVDINYNRKKKFKPNSAIEPTEEENGL